MPYDAPPMSPRYAPDIPAPRTRGGGGQVFRGKKRRSPLWARLCVVLGVFIVLGSGGAFASMKVVVNAATGSVTQRSLIGKAKTQRQHVTITGAKNILLVGVDTRPGAKTAPRSDSIIVLHVTADHQQAFLTSLPRDSYVTIPPYFNGKTHWRGGKLKINAAFQKGAEGLTGDAAWQHGFELLALTVKGITGISFDAGGIIDFPGFRDVVKTLGGVCMYVDEDTTSVHTGHTRSGHPAPPFVIGTDGLIKRPTPGVTPTKYKVGNHCFTPDEALDYVRQRDLLANKDSDYGRQRHQQQFIKAILKKAVDEGLNSPTKLPGLLSAVGKTMTVDSGGIALEDWAFAMRGIKPDNLVTIKTNAGTFNSRTIPGVGSVELLSDTSLELFQNVKNDTVVNFMQAHPDWVSAS